MIFLASRSLVTLLAAFLAWRVFPALESRVPAQMLQASLVMSGIVLLVLNAIGGVLQSTLKSAVEAASLSSEGLSKKRRDRYVERKDAAVTNTITMLCFNTVGFTLAGIVAALPGAISVRFTLSLAAMSLVAGALSLTDSVVGLRLTAKTMSGIRELLDIERQHKVARRVLRADAMGTFEYPPHVVGPPVRVGIIDRSNGQSR